MVGKHQFLLRLHWTSDIFQKVSKINFVGSSKIRVNLLLKMVVANLTAELLNNLKSFSVHLKI